MRVLRQSSNRVAHRNLATVACCTYRVVRWSAMRAIAATMLALLGVLCTADGVPTRPIGNDVIVSLSLVCFAAKFAADNRPRPHPGHRGGLCRHPLR